MDSQAHTQLIEDLMQENARLKQQNQQQYHDHRLQLDQAQQQLEEAQASHQHSTLQLSQQLEQCNRQLLQANRANTDLQQQLQHTSQQLQQAQASHQRSVEQLEQCNRQLLQANHANTDLQQQLQDTSQQLQQAQASHQRSVEQLEQCNRQLLQANREVEQLQRAQQEASAHDIEPWKVARAKVELGDEIARGGWGSVSEGKVRVAVKQLHMAIASERNIQRLRREMRILSQIRHPNLVQFIGAVFDEQAERLLAPPLIITELLDTNLRSAYERNCLNGGQKLSIFKDVAKALKYLHERHDPIIHRDVSAPNVLLEALPGGNWKGKLTDLGSANFARVAQTLAEGAIVYSAPETFPRVFNPDAPPPPQTFKIDVFSFGVMLCEVTTSRFPDQNEYGDMLRQVRNTCPPMYSLIEVCTKEKQEQRPKMTDILRLLDNIREIP